MIDCVMNTDFDLFHRQFLAAKMLVWFILIQIFFVSCLSEEKGEGLIKIKLIIYLIDLLM